MSHLVTTMSIPLTARVAASVVARVVFKITGILGGQSGQLALASDVRDAAVEIA